MKITLIADGWTENHRKIKRWGLSFLVGEEILFDTFGDEKIFFENIKKFNIDILKLEKIVISHHHWDHITGLWKIISENRNCILYICKNFSSEFKKKVYYNNIKTVEVEKMQEIEKNIYTTGEIEGIDSEGKLFEQSLIIKSKDGIVILTGCAHPGINKIVDFVKEKFYGKIYVVAGGFHLRHNKPEEIKRIAEELKERGVEKVIPLHCTGEKGKEIFKEIFKDGFIPLKEGEYLNVNI